MKQLLLKDNRFTNFVSLEWSTVRRNHFYLPLKKIGHFKILSTLHPFASTCYPIVKKVKRKRWKCAHLTLAVLILIVFYMFYSDHYLSIYKQIYFLNKTITARQRITGNMLFKDKVQIDSPPKLEDELLNRILFKQQSLLKTDVPKQTLASFSSESPNFFSILLHPSLNTSFDSSFKALKETLVKKNDHLQRPQIKKFAFTNHSSKRKESLLEKQLSWYELLGIAMFNLIGNLNSASKQESLEQVNKPSIAEVQLKNSTLQIVSIAPEEQKQRLPQCIIIGVRKAGTRAVLEYLSLNNHIRKADNEIHFFDNLNHYALGLEFYRKEMPFSNKHQITIEKSPAYFITNGVPERIKAMNSSIKLILIVRDPVVRLISDYTQLAHNKMLKLNDAIATSKPIMSAVYENNFYSGSNLTQINYLPNSLGAIDVDDSLAEISQLARNDYLQKINKLSIRNIDKKMRSYGNKFKLNSTFLRKNFKHLLTYPINTWNKSRKLFFVDSFKFSNSTKSENNVNIDVNNKSKFNSYFQGKIYYQNNEDDGQNVDEDDLADDGLAKHLEQIQLNEKKTLNFNSNEKVTKKKPFLNHLLASQLNLNLNRIYNRIPKFEQFVIKNGQVNTNYKPVRTSIYSLYMDNWLKVFKRDQIHIVDGDMLVKDPYIELHKIEKFLNIPHQIKRDQFVFNKKKNFYCARIQLDSNDEFLNKKKFFKKSHRFFKKFGERHSAIRCLNTSKGRKHPQVDKNVISKLREFYAPFNRHFFRMVSMKFDWLEI